MESVGVSKSLHGLTRFRVNSSYRNQSPPQELGGYGRSIADFAWGLKRHHTIQVLSSDTPDLGLSTDKGPSGENVNRRLKLKGTYSGGVKHIEDIANGKLTCTIFNSYVTGLIQFSGMEFTRGILISSDRN